MKALRIVRPALLEHQFADVWVETWLHATLEFRHKRGVGKVHCSDQLCV